MKDFKYIIKRILIGVGIILLLGFIKSNGVNAKTINTYNFDTVTWPIPNGTHIIDMGFGGWSTNKGDGYIIFNFVYHAGGMINSSIRDVWINNMNGQNTECILNPTFMHENGEGSTKPNDYNNILYSVICPVSFTNNNGLNHLYFASTQTQSSSVAQQKIVVSRSITFVGDDDFGAVLDTLRTDLINTLNDNRGQIRADLGVINTNLSTLITSLQQNQNKLQEQINEQKETNKKLDELNDNITSSDVSGASGSSNSMLNSVNTDMPNGLTGIITTPMRIVNAMNNSCTPISFTLPVYNEPVTINCMSSSVYNKYPELITLISTIINGFLVYRLIKMLFFMVKDFKDPDSDRVEVMDL